MAAKKKAKSGAANAAVNHGDTVVNLFTALDGGKIKTNVMEEVEAVKKEIADSKTVVSYQEWGDCIAALEGYGKDGKISSIVYSTFHDLFTKKRTGVRLSKLVNDRLKGLYNEFMSKDDNGERVYNVVETNAKTKAKMIVKVNKEFDKVEEKLKSLYADLSNRSDL